MSTQNVIAEIGRSCLLMRTRLIARVVTAIHDDALRPFGIGSPQFVLLAVIHKIQPATRSEIGRFHHQDRSTLTRNLKVILSQGWAEEDPAQAAGRRRPIVLTQGGRDLVIAAIPAWRRAQVKSKAALGAAGATAVMAIADRIMQPPGTP